MRAGCGMQSRRARRAGFLAAFGDSQLHVEVRVGWESRPDVDVDTASHASSASVTGTCACVWQGRESVAKGGGTASTFWLSLDCWATTVPFKRRKQQLCCTGSPPPPPPVHFRLPLVCNAGTCSRSPTIPDQGLGHLRAVLEHTSRHLSIHLRQSWAKSRQQSSASPSVKLARDFIQIRAQPGGKGVSSSKSLE